MLSCNGVVEYGAKYSVKSGRITLVRKSDDNEPVEALAQAS